MKSFMAGIIGFTCLVLGYMTGVKAGIKEGVDASIKTYNMAAKEIGVKDELIGKVKEVMNR